MFVVVETSSKHQRVQVIVTLNGRVAHLHQHLNGQTPISAPRGIYNIRHMPPRSKCQNSGDIAGGATFCFAPHLEMHCGGPRGWRWLARRWLLPEVVSVLGSPFLSSTNPYGELFTAPSKPLLTSGSSVFLLHGLNWFTSPHQSAYRDDIGWKTRTAERGREGTYGRDFMVG